MTLFVSCGPGIEPFLADELLELGFSDIYAGYCGVYVNTQSEVDCMNAVYSINYRSRLAIRVLLPLHKFRCYDQNALYKGAANIEWHRYIRKNHTIAIDANVHHPRLRNSLFCAQVVKDAICDQLRERNGSRPSVDVQSPDVQLNLFIHRDEAIISFDTSGDPLHKRGYRQDAGEAPMQETMAATLLRLAKYKGNEVVIDPCCGSGTILIEAALMATKTAPGYLRKRWGFANHPHFINQDWLTIKNAADALRVPYTSQMFGCEIESDVARMCRANLRAAGFLQNVEIIRTDFVEYVPPIQPNFLITNPPHGRRLQGERSSLNALYRNLGNFMKQKMAKPSRGFIFVGDLPLAKEVGLAAKQRYVINNSGVDSRLLEFDLY